MGHMVQGKTTEVEPWYQTEYSQEPVPSGWLSGWLKAFPNDSIHLPRPNPFISSQFGLIDVSLLPLAFCLQRPPVLLQYFPDVSEHACHQCLCPRYHRNK